MGLFNNIKLHLAHPLAWHAVRDVNPAYEYPIVGGELPHRLFERREAITSGLAHIK